MTNRLELNWKLDGFVDEQRYYCSETPIDVNNLPTPKEILAGDTLAHIDTNIEENKTYFIAIGSYMKGVEKVSNIAMITTKTHAKLNIVPASQRNAGVSSPITYVNLKVAPFEINDIIIVVVRTFNIPSIDGFNKILDLENGFFVFSKIANLASTQETIQRVTMGYGGAVSFVLRPSKTITTVECYGHASEYLSASVANDTIVRHLMTPSVISDKSEVFEIDMLSWDVIYASLPICNILSDQTIIATRSSPIVVGDGFNFVVAGKTRSSISLINGAVFNISKIPAGDQNIRAITAMIYAK
ncbi:hypothetical protein [Acinetobacter sp. YH12233]|uniref:hypothetical protein n=1 Tax=Acinetobacter sp. YH12233 TaxID=2601161 RepID=UPI0015D36425|nr:hypothetical protein [Acinetobacter sp. YH12233]